MGSALAEIAVRIAHAALKAAHDALEAKVAAYERAHETAQEMHLRHVAEEAEWYSNQGKETP